MTLRAYNCDNNAFSFNCSKNWLAAILSTTMQVSRSKRSFRLNLGLNNVKAIKLITNWRFLKAKAITMRMGRTSLLVVANQKSLTSSLLTSQCLFSYLKC